MVTDPLRRRTRRWKRTIHRGKTREHMHSLLQPFASGPGFGHGYSNSSSSFKYVIVRPGFNFHVLLIFVIPARQRPTSNLCN